jgi:hypothetical protein
MPLEGAVTEAVRRCVQEGILAGFLVEHSSEVMNLLREEWDWDEAKEAWREEVWELAEAKYRPLIAEKEQALMEKDREIAELRRKLEGR